MQRKLDNKLENLVPKLVLFPNNSNQQKEQKLTLKDIPIMGWDNPPTELLILSACQTAPGENEDAELGFAGIAYRSGVKSVLASLWKVNDAAVPPLIAEFYFWLSRGSTQTKAEALRQAQLRLLKGTVSVQNGYLRWSGGETNWPNHFSSIPDLPHPYYWSGFTIVGSPW